MVGVVIASHGRLAEELLNAAVAMVGPLPQVRTVSLNRVTCKPAEELSTAIDAMDEGEGVLVLADLFGGSPSQAACGLLHDKRVEVVSGVNLPMVLKLATIRDGKSLGDLARLLTLYGQKNVVHASELVRQVEAQPAPSATSASAPAKP
ncbi:MAG: PTS fructose transporter subunit IIA [Deltaproteobacteria bacterium]|nr:PTS fructose transporter subunit IIA [Deltaproteobacteria bacterium]